MRTIYLNGEFAKADDQILNAFAPGIFKARGVFETMLGMDDEVLDVPLHLKRLNAGLKSLGIKAPSIKAPILRQVLKRNRLATARLRLMVWQANGKVQVMIVALPYHPTQKACRVCLIKTNRPASDRFSSVKSLDYHLFAEAFDKARAKGFDEALLLNSKGHIFEASRANIFWVKDKILYTPPLSSGCLNGITRQQVMKHAARLRAPVREAVLTPAILSQADTAFLTNSLIGIRPLASI